MEIKAKDKRRRDKRINFWLTEKEHSDIEQRAKAYDMTISEYIRTLALNADIKMDLTKVSAGKTGTPVVKKACDKLSDDNLISMVESFIKESSESLPNSEEV